MLTSAGTHNTAIGLTASAGGIENQFAADKTYTIKNADNDLSIVLTDDSSTAVNEKIVLTNTNGTAASAINLEASAGGVLVSADGNIASAIKLHATAGTSQTIDLINTAGTGAGAITLTSTAGGVDIDAAAAKDVNIAGGQVALVSKDDAASAISLTANVGTSETIVLTNTQGTGAGAITLTSTAGGVDINAGAGVTIDAAGASNLTTSSGALTLQGAGGVDIAASGVATTIKGTFNVDEAATFDTTVGVSGALTMDTDKKIQFRDSALFINSSADGQLDIDADTTLQITAPTVDIDASTEVNISNALTVGGTLTIGGTALTSTAAELNILDGVTATTTELNYVDGVTSAIQTQIDAKQATITGAATTITSSDLTASRAIVSNASGKVEVSAVTSTELGYLDGVTSAIQTQLDSKLGTGSAFDSGTANITTGGILKIDVDGTAIGSAGSLTIGAGSDAGLYVSSDNLVIENVTQDKDIVFKVNDGGSATTVATVDGDVGLFNVEADKLAINGTAITSTAAELNILDGVTATTAELNYVDGVTSAIQTQLDAKQASLTFGISDTNVIKCGAGIVDDDFLRINGTTLEGRSASELLTDIGAQAALTFGISDTNVIKCGAGIVDDDFLRINGTTLEGRSASEVKSDLGLGNVEDTAVSTFTGSSNIVTTGALASGSIASGFGAIDNGTSNITTGGILTIDVDGTAIGSAGSLTLGAGNDAGLYVSSDNLVIENVTQDKDIIFKVNDGGSATTVATVDGDVGLFNVEANKLAINGTAITSTAAELNILDGVTATAAELNKIASLTDGTVSASKAVVADASKDISGFRNISADGNLTVAGNLTINGTTTTVNSTVTTIADPIMTLGANGSDDNKDRGLELLYNDGSAKKAFMGYDDSAGKFTMLTAATNTSEVFTGTTGTLVANLEGNVTGNTSGSAATVTGAAQTAITSVGTLTALTVDDVNIDGKVITMTGDTDDTVVFTAGTNGTLSIVTTDTNAAAANITITADGTAELAGTTVTLNSSGGITLDADGGTITFADAGSSLGTITSSGYSGNAATATKLASAVNIGGVSFDGSAAINLPGVNAAGSQDTTGNAATATALANARTLGGVSFDGTSNIDLPGVNAEGNQNTTGSAATLTTARTIGGVSFNGSANIDLPGVNAEGNQNTTGSAATLTTARTIGGVSFNGSANIDLPGVNTAGNQATTGNAATATKLASAVNIGGVSFDGSAAINLPGVNAAGSQDTTGNAATATALANARTIGGVSFDGTANIDLPGVNSAGNQNTTGSAATVTGAAQTAITSVGTLTALTVDDVNIDGKVITMTGDTNDTVVFTAGTNGTLSIVTTDTAAAAANITITADGTAELAGTTVTLNSSGGITLDADGGTITFADAGSSLGTITSSGYSGNAATATALANARTIGGVSFDGTANINLPGVNASGSQDTTGNAATATKLASAVNIGGVSFDGSAAINLPGVNAAGSQDTTGNAATATALANARTIGGVSFDGTSNIDLPGVNSEGNQNTTGSAATLTTARTIGGVSFNGSANIDLPGVNAEGNQNTTGSAATLTTARTIGGVSFNGSANIDLPGVNTAGNQATTGNAATATKLASAVNIGGVSFDGSAAINLPGVNTSGTEDTTGNAATATALANARTIGGVSFDGTANIDLPGVNSAGNQNTTGSAATVTGAAQTAITSVGTLTALAVDNLSLDGNAITSTDSNGAISITPNGTGAINLGASNSKIGLFGTTAANQPSAIADITTTFTANSKSATGSHTISDGDAPTNAELLQYCVELESKLESALAALRTLGIIDT